MKTYKGLVYSLFFLFFSIESIAAVKVEYSSTFTVSTSVVESKKNVKDNVEIIGQAKGAEGRSLKLKIKEDYISGAERIAAETPIDSLGNFRLSAYIPHTQQAYLQIDYYQSEIFLEEENRYKIQFLPFDYHQNEKINVLVNPHALENLAYVFEKNDTAELNYMIWQFTYDYIRFMDAHFYAIIRGKERDSAREFIERMRANFAYSGHAFFNNYLNYKLASVENFAKLGDEKKRFEKYVKDKPIHYNNPAQMEFMMDTYKNYFANQRKIRPKQWQLMFNGRSDLAGILDSMGHDSTLRNELVREWVFLYAVNGLLREDASYDRERLISLLEELAQITKFKEHAEIAEYIVSENRRKFDRNYFKDIAFRTFEDSLSSAQNLLEKGKLHYVAFVSADNKKCPDCLVEMAYLQKIMPKYTDIAKVIVINTDYEYARYFHHASEKPYIWPYLHFNKEIDWLKEVGAIHSPYFMLTDDKGKVLQSDCVSPSGGIELILKKIVEEKKVKTEKAKEEKPPKR